MAADLAASWRPELARDGADGVIDRSQDARHSAGPNGGSTPRTCLELASRNPSWQRSCVTASTDRTYDRKRSDPHAASPLASRGPSTYGSRPFARTTAGNAPDESRLWSRRLSFPECLHDLVLQRFHQIGHDGAIASLDEGFDRHSGLELQSVQPGDLFRAQPDP